MNAVIVTVLLLLLSPADQEPEIVLKPRWGIALGLALVLWIATTAGLPWLMTKHVRHIYGNKSAGHSGTNIRWGEEANWRVSPNLRGVPHR